jgi:hypothetical protein
MYRVASTTQLSAQSDNSVLAKAKQELGFSLYERGECMTESDVDQYVTHV